jgi:hypothetical protein
LQFWRAEARVGPSRKMFLHGFIRVIFFQNSTRASFHLIFSKSLVSSVERVCCDLIVAEHAPPGLTRPRAVRQCDESFSDLFERAHPGKPTRATFRDLPLHASSAVEKVARRLVFCSLRGIGEESYRVNLRH